MSFIPACATILQRSLHSLHKVASIQTVLISYLVVWVTSAAILIDQARQSGSCVLMGHSESMCLCPFAVDFSAFPSLALDTRRLPAGLVRHALLLITPLVGI
jgi:hypothetical protein